MSNWEEKIQYTDFIMNFLEVDMNMNKFHVKIRKEALKKLNSLNEFEDEVWEEKAKRGLMEYANTINLLIREKQQIYSDFLETLENINPPQEYKDYHIKIEAAMVVYLDTIPIEIEAVTELQLGNIEKSNELSDMAENLIKLADNGFHYGIDGINSYNLSHLPE